ncbi:MAG TPA: rhodanese-like domain-containing protein [Planctomycetota bacterium]|nr:rhodanese-like domain-containing protein [Planctomycetota bacterium]
MPLFDILTIAALAVALIALLRSGSGGGKLAALQTQVDELKRTVTSREADAQELQESVDGLRKLLALQAAGKPVDPEMVKENRLYRNAKVAELQAAFAAGSPPSVLDVRTPQEFAGGHIEGALHIPVDDISKRLNEVPRDGRKLYVICAGGGRSSAAAAFLANRGYLNVHNVEGGMSTWRDKVVKA